MSEISLRERFFTVRDDNVRPFVHAWLTATFTAPCLVLLPFIIADGDGVLAALILPLLVLPWGAVISAPLAFAALVAVAPLYWLLKGRGVSRMDHAPEPGHDLRAARRRADRSAERLGLLARICRSASGTVNGYEEPRDP